MRAWRYATTALAGLLAVSAAGAAPALSPHRAVYDLVLHEASERSGINGIAGRMVYEFDGSACEGYTVNFRFVTQIDTDEVSRINDIRSSSHEDGDGRRFSFMTKSFTDDTLEQEVRGRAEIGADGTQVTIEAPERRVLELEPTQFPTRHMMELIGKAGEGETFYETTLFDASEDADKVMTTTVVIGRKADVARGDPERDALGELAGDGFWPVDMAYFDLSEGMGEEIPGYRISFRLHENGVTRDLLMDYGDFAMKGTLVDLEMLAIDPDCDR